MTTLQITTVNPAEFGLDENKTVQIREAFMPKILERESLVSLYKEIVSQEISEELSLQAGALRKKLVKVRTGIADIHQSQKAFFLSAGRFVDAWKNKETTPVLQMEEALFKIEKHFELIEQKRLEDLGKARTQELLKFNPQFIPDNLGKMEAHVWESYVLGVRLSFEAEQKRIADAKAERIAKEKAEAEAREAKAKKEAEERAELVKQNKELEQAKAKAEAEAKAEKAKADAEKKALEDKLAEEKRTAYAKLKAEQEATRKAEAELKAKKDAEAKAEAEAKAKKLAEDKAKAEADRKAKNAPDKEKLKAFSVSLKAIERPQVKSEEAKAILANIEDLMSRLTDYINMKTEAL